MRVRTLEAPRFADEWSFSGRGRWKSKAATLERPAGASSDVIVADRAEPEADAPVEPGEPRG